VDSVDFGGVAFSVECAMTTLLSCPEELVLTHTHTHTHSHAHPHVHTDTHRYTHPYAHPDRWTGVGSYTTNNNA